MPHTRETHEQEAFCREGDDVPDGQEARDVGQVDERLAPAAAVVDVGAPGQEDAEQERRVARRQRRQVDVTRSALQVRAYEHCK